MKIKARYLLITAVLIANLSTAQSVDPSILKAYNRIINLIQNDSVNTLSALIEYPLRRDNPLPDIKSAKEFKDYYTTLIDPAFKELLSHYKDSDVFQHEGLYGLVGGPFRGEMWIDDAGKITGINYSSAAEKKLKADLIAKTKSSMYEDVRDWDENIIVAKTPKLIFRIDRTKNGLRYVSWSAPKTYADQPDIVIENGTAEAQGTMGGWIWTFKNANWTYMIQDVETGESADEMGYFLMLYKDNKQVQSTKCTVVK